MGLKQDIENDLIDAFNIDLSDAVQSFSYIVVDQTFDPNTNLLVETETSYLSRGVFTNYKREIMQDSSILSTDEKLIILQVELAIVPEKNMKIKRDTKEQTIISVKEDPVSATWTLQCRE